MTRNLISLHYVCARCQSSQARLGRTPLPPLSAPLSTSARRTQQQPARSDADASQTPPQTAQMGKSEQTKDEAEDGAMSRLLRDMSEESLATGGRRARKAVEEAGFNDELKQQLLDRISDANFRAKHPAAFAQVQMPTAAGKGTRDMAAAKPWTGSETTEDAALRMLTDAHKPLRGMGPPKIPVPRGMPIKVTTGQKPAQPTGIRLANARDKTSMYTYLKDDTLNAEEKEKFRAELKARFAPSARSVPATLRGLESLANERIEDAIARGQFKNLPRGQKLERDYNMSSPFIDTTSYFLNKIIKKQEIVPPWIEKQQELTSTATRFRARLRNDWRRHAARMIASQGGPLEAQVRRAEQYAAAEAVVNPPPKKKVETIDTVDDEGHISQITLSGELKIDPEDSSAPPVETITVTETPLEPTPAPTPTSTLDSQASSEPATTPSAAAAAATTATAGGEIPSPNSSSSSVPSSSPDPQPTPESANPYINSGAIYTFRDPAWEAAENSYLTVAITNLNALTRSYNLMAPQLAKKPYFSLDRELRACFADVAPQLPGEIRNRAAALRVRVEVNMHKEGGVLEKFSREERVRVHDERKPQYGFKEFWKDLWAKA